MARHGGYTAAIGYGKAATVPNCGKLAAIYADTHLRLVGDGPSRSRNWMSQGSDAAVRLAALVAMMREVQSAATRSRQEMDRRRARGEEVGTEFVAAQLAVVLPRMEQLVAETRAAHAMLDEMKRLL